MNASFRRGGALAGLLVCAALLVLAFGPAGCGSARRSEPIAGPLNLSDADPSDQAALRGQLVFMAHCFQCHPAGEAGLGPGLNDKPVPGVAIKVQVRNGLGAMPAFSEEEIGEQELDDLVAYLFALRGNEPERQR